MTKTLWTGLCLGALLGFVAGILLDHEDERYEILHETSGFLRPA